MSLWIYQDYDVIKITHNLQDQIDEMKGTGLVLTDRALQSFAISSQSAGEKYVNMDKSNKFDLRTYSTGGKTYYLWLFSKTFKHDSNGLTTKEDIDRLIEVSKLRGSKDSIDALSQSQDPNKNRKLEGVATGNSFWISGPDTQYYNASNGYLIADSIENVCEMIEVYEKSLLRDTSFFNIQNSSNSNILRAINSMNNYVALSGYKGPVNSGTNLVTGKELFRGIAKDVTVGPYISQFLIHSYSYNGITIEQKYPVENDVTESTNLANYINIQRGIVTGPPNFSGSVSYIYSGRVLGSIVHNDPLYWAYYNAALIAHQNGLQMNYNGNEITSAWTDQGFVDCMSSLADVSLAALRVAWHSKYNVGLKLRPEALAHRISMILSNVFTGTEFDTIKNNLTPGQNTLDAVFAQNSNHLLTLMYPEGSPTHPSYPAGHAVVAGACSTILKAFFKTHDSTYNPLPWTPPIQHSTNGISKITYNEADSKEITICGEFNKLASNISIGRNIAGVHYRADGDYGMILGEQFAIKYLQTKLKEYASTYNEMVKDFKLEKFNGEYIKITTTNIETLKTR